MGRKSAFRIITCLSKVTRLGFNKENLSQIAQLSVRIVQPRGQIQVAPSGPKCRSHHVAAKLEVALGVMMVVMHHSSNPPFLVSGGMVQETAARVATRAAVHRCLIGFCAQIVIAKAVEPLWTIKSWIL